MIDLHSTCLLNIMRFGLMERLKALSMVAIITWTSREACGRIASALARHCGGAAPAEVTADMLLAIVRIPDFVEGIDRAERDFTEVPPRPQSPLHRGALSSFGWSDRQSRAPLRSSPALICPYQLTGSVVAEATADTAWPRGHAVGRSPLVHLLLHASYLALWEPDGQSWSANARGLDVAVLYLVMECASPGLGTMP